MVEIRLKKIGDSYFLIVPKYLIDTYRMLVEDFLYDVEAQGGGKTLIYKRRNEKQLHLKDVKGGLR